MSLELILKSDDGKKKAHYFRINFLTLTLRIARNIFPMILRVAVIMKKGINLFRYREGGYQENKSFLNKK